MNIIKHKKEERRKQESWNVIKDTHLALRGNKLQFLRNTIRTFFADMFTDRFFQQIRLNKCFWRKYSVCPFLLCFNVSTLTLKLENNEIILSWEKIWRRKVTGKVSPWNITVLQLIVVFRTLDKWANHGGQVAALLHRYYNPGKKDFFLLLKLEKSTDFPDSQVQLCTLSGSVLMQYGHQAVEWYPDKLLMMLTAKVTAAFHLWSVFLSFVIYSCSVDSKRPSPVSVL